MGPESNLVLTSYNVSQGYLWARPIYSWCYHGEPKPVNLEQPFEAHLWTACANSIFPIEYKSSSFPVNYGGMLG